MIGLGLGLTLSAARAQIFDLAHLFTSGSGFCYPLSPGTLWQDAAGTLPVTADGQVVGLMLDKSKGLVLGPELVTNGTFDTNLSGWTVDSGNVSVWDAGRAYVGGGGSITGIYAEFPTVAGKTYLVTGVIQHVTGDGARIRVTTGGGFTGAQDSNVVTSGTARVQVYAVATASTMRILLRASGSLFSPLSAYYDNISVREVLGNHAPQPGSASIRPVYKINPTRLSFDGSDDRLVSALNPTTSGTIACRFQTSTAPRVMIGSQGATDGRCYLGIGSDGRLAAGIGAAGMTTITGGTDIRGTGWRSGAVTWNGSTVKLYLDGAEVYSGAQSGAVNTTIPMAIGALNANGTQNTFFGGGILANPIALDYAATPAQIAQMHQAWSNQT